MLTRHMTLEQFYSRLGSSRRSSLLRCKTFANLPLYFQSLPGCLTRNPFPFTFLHGCRGVAIPSYPQHLRHLTHCSRPSPHLDFLCFHTLINCPICKSSILTTLQQYPGVVGGLLEILEMRQAERRAKILAKLDPVLFRDGQK